MNTLADFIKELDQSKEKLVEQAETAIQSMIVDIQGRLISRPSEGGTPIDTRRASGSWGIDKDSAGNFELPEAPKGTVGEYYTDQEARSQQTKVEKFKLGEQWHIYNNMEYIVELNNGSSEQAPEGFVEDAVESAESAFITEAKKMRLE